MIKLFEPFYNYFIFGKFYLAKIEHMECYFSWIINTCYQE